MENTTVLTEEELKKQQNTRNIIRVLKEQLVNHMIVKRAENNDDISSDDMIKLRSKHPFKFEYDYITLIHIIHNRLRRGNKRPHLGTVEREHEFILRNSFEFDKIKEFLKQNGFNEEDLINI